MEREVADIEVRPDRERERRRLRRVRPDRDLIGPVAVTSPAATGDGAAAVVESARSYVSCPAFASIATLVSQPDRGTQSMPLSERRSFSSESVAFALWSMRMPFAPTGTGSI